MGWQPYHIHVPIVLKFGSLNLLGFSGPVQVFLGIFNFHYYYYYHHHHHHLLYAGYLYLYS